MTLMDRVVTEQAQASVAQGCDALPESYWWGERSPLLRQITKTYYLAMMAKQLQTPTPRDKPEYRSRAEKAYKVLLIGNGPTHGWGVTTHGLALTGQIATSLSRNSGQPVDLDYVGEELLNASTTLGFLGDRDVSVYDLIVVVLSLNDALRLTPADEWERDVNNSLDYLRQKRAPGVQMLVVGIQSADTAVGYSNFLGKLAQRHADRLNARMAHCVAAHGDTFTPLSAPYLAPGIGSRDRETYATWGEEISLNLLRLLPSYPPSERPLPEAKWDRPALEKVLGYDGVDRSEKLREIAGRAKRAFLTPVAYITITDHGQQYTPTATGSMAAALPIDLSYCKYTVQSDEPVVIENALKDERFAGNGYVDAVNMPFYAGQSLKSEDGEVIGTFCVMGPLPKSEKRFAMDKFEKFAAEAQEALREIERGNY